MNGGGNLKPSNLFITKNEHYSMVIQDSFFGHCISTMTY